MMSRPAHVGGSLGEFIGCRSIGGGRAFGNLLLDHSHEFFVRRPERLANADRVIDNLA